MLKCFSLLLFGFYFSQILREDFAQVSFELNCAYLFAPSKYKVESLPRVKDQFHKSNKLKPAQVIS